MICYSNGQASCTGSSPSTCSYSTLFVSSSGGSGGSGGSSGSGGNSGNSTGPNGSLKSSAFQPFKVANAMILILTVTLVFI